MSKNKYTPSLAKLNEYLFEQLDELNNPDLTDEELDKAIKRSKAISDVSGQLLNSADISIKAYAILAKEGRILDSKSVELIAGVQDE